MNLKENLYIENPVNPLKDFERISEVLLNSSVLKVGSKSFRICAIEFYYKQADHMDNAAHAHKRQLTCGAWYFHGSGLDITFGDETEYGGILIQAIQNVEEPRIFTAGPLKCVTALFEAFGSASNHRLTFGLEEYRHEHEKIIAAPRVGLNEVTVGDHFSKGYRFIIMPKEPHIRKGDIVKYLVDSKLMTEEQAKKEIYK
ncbi:hypothetical protein C9994_09180 [Marivirga lumbricoides]|uniref:Uncharacterized protein n=1 Tax=Marivirga lumbricoides TaxID=1046115 RepID=A0A2T4DQF9_9BACT|nr:hypothetical protein C9994_09180 [Marivirga lumbricoides]